LVVSYRFQLEDQDPTIIGIANGGEAYSINYDNGNLNFDQGDFTSLTAKLIWTLLSFFPLYAAIRRIPIYEEFVEGAKEGFQIAIRIIPFLVGMLVAIGMFRGAGGIEMLTPLWWSLAMGACLGGNGSLIGAAANVMVAGLGERAGHPIRFFQFFKIGFPVMLFSIVIAHLYLYLRFF